MEYGKKILTYRNYIVFEKFATPYFRRAPKEFFENEACFIFINEGRFSVRAQTAYHNLDRESAILAKCQNFFFETDETQRNSSEGIEVTGVLLYPQLVEELFQFELSAYSYTVDYTLKQVQVDALLANFRESINILLDHPELADEAMIKTKLKEFVLLISKSQDAPSHLDFLSAMFKPAHIDFKATIAQNIYSSLSLDELAALCHMSASSFKRRFKEVFGESPAKFISQQKTRRAAELLSTPDLRVSEIAYASGFETIASFNRNFKAQFGVSPTEYRLTQIAKGLT
ncbi:MAG: AraC family transcriptional regulator [Bacteroidia bacterium]